MISRTWGSYAQGDTFKTDDVCEWMLVDPRTRR